MTSLSERPLVDGVITTSLHQQEYGTEQHGQFRSGSMCHGPEAIVHKDWGLYQNNGG